LTQAERMYVTTLYAVLFRFTDKSLKPIEDVEGVIYLESDSADKSLWCRLALSCRRLVNYILLIAAGEHFAFV